MDDKTPIEKYLKSELPQMVRILHTISQISGNSAPIQSPSPYTYSYDSTNLVHILEHAQKQLTLEKDVYGDEYRFIYPENKTPVKLRYNTSTKTVSF
jgi:hypothetical protein